MLTELSLAQLNVAHNRAVVEHKLPFKEIKGFHDKPTGQKRLAKIMAQFGLELDGYRLVKAADGLAGLNADMAGLAAHGVEAKPVAPAKKAAPKAKAKPDADHPLVAGFKKAMKAAKPDTAPKPAPQAKKVAKVKKAAKPDALKQMADALVKPRMHRGPVPEFHDAQVITVLVTNPKRLGSEAHRRYDLYRTGMTVGEARAAGLKRTDFRYDTHPKRKHVSIV
jgi:hypothetical protein